MVRNCTTVWFLLLGNVDCCDNVMIGITAADAAGIVAYDRSNRTSVAILGDNEVPDRKEANGRRDAVHAPLQ